MGLDKVAAQVEIGVRDESPLTLALYADRWIADRRKRGLSCAQDNEGRLAHVLPMLGGLRLDEVRPRHVRNLARALAAMVGPADDQLAPRTVHHIYGTLHTLFEDAVADELVDANPCALKRGELPKKVDKDPTWRSGAIFTREEVELLISDQRIPLDRRVINSILLIGGLRFGELAAIRWRNYDAGILPLGKLVVAHSYDFKRKKKKSVKSLVPRDVPVHPTLAAVLEAWRSGGWESMVGRAPTADDLIVPPRPEWTDEPFRNVNRALRRFHEDLAHLGLRRRRQHDLRRTFITIARSDGARKDFLEHITHGPRGDIMDLYTTVPWDVLCEEVAQLRISLPEVTSGGAPRQEPRARRRSSPSSRWAVL